MQNELSFCMQQPRCKWGRRGVAVREGYLAQTAMQPVTMAEGGVAMVAARSRWQLLWFFFSMFRQRLLPLLSFFVLFFCSPLRSLFLSGFSVFLPLYFYFSFSFFKKIFSSSSNSQASSSYDTAHMRNERVRLSELSFFQSPFLFSLYPHFFLCLTL